MATRSALSARPSTDTTSWKRPSPVLITVTSGVVEPRYPTFKGIMAAKSKPIDQITAGDLGVTIAPGQEIVSVRPAPERAAGEIIEDDGEAHVRIIAPPRTGKGDLDGHRQDVGFCRGTRRPTGGDQPRAADEGAYLRR